MTGIFFFQVEYHYDLTKASRHLWARELVIYKGVQNVPRSCKALVKVLSLPFVCSQISTRTPFYIHTSIIEWHFEVRRACPLPHTRYWWRMSIVWNNESFFPLHSHFYSHYIYPCLVSAARISSILSYSKINRKSSKLWKGPGNKRIIKVEYISRSCYHVTAKSLYLLVTGINQLRAMTVAKVLWSACCSPIRDWPPGQDHYSRPTTG